MGWGLRAACALLLATACEAGDLGSGSRGGGRPEDSLAVCADATLAVDAVRGDVNDTFLHATLRVNGAPKEAQDVTFRVPDEGGTFWTVGSILTDAAGEAYVDLGAVVLTDSARAGAVERARTLEAVSVAADPACKVVATAEFAPTVRTVTQPPSAAASKQALVRGLRRVGAALDLKSSSRLPDGTSACRLLWALTEDAAAHPEWLSDQPESDVERLRGARESCPGMRGLAGLDVRSVLNDIDSPFD